jgi:hypothetical protein
MFIGLLKAKNEAHFPPLDTCKLYLCSAVPEVHKAFTNIP